MAEPERLSKLTERQRDCLRLVLVRRNSKEIARELGIAKTTVDKHLAAAILLLDVGTRFDAARLLRAAEHPPISVGGYSIGISDPIESVTYDPAPDVGVVSEAHNGQLPIREERATFYVDPALSTRRTSRLRLFTWGVERNDLTVFQRCAYVLILIAAIMLTTGIGAVALVGLTALLRAVFHGTPTVISI